MKLEDKYQEVLRIIKAKEELRWKILGPQLLENASPLYFEMSTIDSLEISPVEWDNLSVEQQAKLMVYMEIKGKFDLIHRYYVEKHFDDERKANQ